MFWRLGVNPEYSHTKIAKGAKTLKVHQWQRRIRWVLIGSYTESAYRGQPASRRSESQRPMISAELLHFRPSAQTLAGHDWKDARIPARRDAEDTRSESNAPLSIC